MSMKNHRPLIISSAVIISLTAGSLLSLNLIVDHISKLSPPMIAMGDASPKNGKANILNSGAPDDAAMPAKAHPPSAKDDMKVRAKMPEMKEHGTDDVMRRVRNGKDSPDIRRTPPPPSSTSPAARDDSANSRGASPQNSYPPANQNDGQNGYGAPPGYPPAGYPPPPNYPPPQDYPPTPDYYTPPNNEDYYDYEDYGDEYDYNSDGYDSKNHTFDRDDEKAAGIHDVKNANAAADLTERPKPFDEQHDEYLGDDEPEDY